MIGQVNLLEGMARYADWIQGCISIALLAEVFKFPVLYSALRCEPDLMNL